LFFDAAIGGFIMEGHVKEMMRVYSEHLDFKMLKCIQSETLKWL
jgi:riboflavin synthase alpha subunit